MRWLALALGLLAGAPGAVSAGEADARLVKLETAWRDWYAAHRVGDTALAVAEDGALGLSLARDAAPGRAAPLASLSKAITAACIADLERAGLVSYSAALADYLPDAPEDLTVAQLLTHAGGVWPDGTQARMWDWVNDAVNRFDEATAAALARPLETPSYRYNNENYAVLGRVVEVVTGTGFEEACAERVFEPLALETPARNPRYGAFLPWGGWEMSAAEYALFADATFAGVDPGAFPSAPVGRGARYGMGALYFEAEGLRITWHTGLLCFGSIDGAGAYFVQVAPGPTVAVTFDGCPGEGALAALDQALLTALLR
ncbi:MAG: serine hydrolase domain-containing protein [Pseudomonadota bacterium]